MILRFAAIAGTAVELLDDGLRHANVGGAEAQVWRDAPGQALLSRVLAGCIVAATGERTARAAGVACGRARTSDIVDAVVVFTAIRLAAPVVTGDRADLGVRAEALGAPLVVLAP